MAKPRKSNAVKGEASLWRSRTHFKILVKPVLIQIALLVLHVVVAAFVPFNTTWDWWNNWSQLIMHSVILIIEIWYVVIPIIDWRTGWYELTDRRVMKEWGIIEKYSREIPLDRIVSVSVERDIIDRIFGCGTIVLQDAAGEGQPEASGSWNKKRERGSFGVRFYDVPDILEVKKLIDEARYGYEKS